MLLLLKRIFLFPKTNVETLRAQFWVVETDRSNSMLLNLLDKIKYGLKFSILVLMIMANSFAFAQNNVGNPWSVWLPEGNTWTGGDAPNAAFSINAQSNKLSAIVGTSSSNACKSYTIGSDNRGYVYYDDNINRKLRVIDPSSQLVYAVFDYAALPNMGTLHCISGFFIAATNKYYLAVSSVGAATSAVGAIAILDVTDPGAISVTKYIPITGLSKQALSSNNTNRPSRLTGMVLYQTTYTSAAVSMYLVFDDAIKTGSVISVTTANPGRHPGAFVKITNPLAASPTISIFETYYSATNFIAPWDDNGDLGAHQIAFDPVNSLVYISGETDNKILSFNATTGAATNVVYKVNDANPYSGFHGIYVTKSGNDIYAGRAYVPANGDKAYKFTRTTTAGASYPTLASPELSTTSDPWVKGVNFTPDETYLYATTDNPGEVYLLDKTNLSIIQKVQKPSGGNASFNYIDPHSYAYTLNDFGDAPYSYGLAGHYLANDNYVNDLLRIGLTLDGDTLALYSANADGDNSSANPKTDDEDGYAVAQKLAAVGLYYGITGIYSINNVVVKNTSLNPAKLVAWIDFNHDGYFQTSEGISVNVPINTISVNLSWTIPATVTPGKLVLRMRISTDPSLLVSTPTEIVFDGEVEDHIYDPKVPVSGNVFNDVSGNTIYGSGGTTGTGESGTTCGVPLYAYLIVNGIIVDSAHVNALGQFTFPNAPQNAGGASVVIGSNSIAPGSAASGITNIATTPPAGWSYTGSSATTTSNGTSGNLGVTLSNTSIINQNFGLQRLPESAVHSEVIGQNPGGTVNTTVNPLWFVTSNVGANPNTLDYDGGTVDFIRITAFPSNATSITINGIQYTSATWPVGGVTIPFTPGVGPTQTIAVDPIDGSISVVIPFASIDNAGMEDPTPGSVTIQYTYTLPVKLQSFTAFPNDNTVLLNWIIAEEINVAHYEVEYSTDGRNYRSIYSIAATNSRNYSSIHTSPASGINYYRLKVVDTDLKMTYSDIRKVNFTNRQSGITVFPNPVNERINISIPSSLINKTATISLYDVDNKLVFTKDLKILGQTEILNTNLLPAGNYFLVVNSNSETYTVKVIKTK